MMLNDYQSLAAGALFAGIGGEVCLRDIGLRTDPGGEVFASPWIIGITAAMPVVIPPGAHATERVPFVSCTWLARHFHPPLCP